MCPEQSEVVPNYAYFPVVFEEKETGITREKIADKLAENNIFARKYFYPLTSDFKCCKDQGITADVPIAEYISNRVLTLPCYSDLECKDVNRICDLILEEY